MARSQTEEVQSVIRAFLDGSGGRWDWDDFLSENIDDPVLSLVQRFAAELPIRFPPGKSRHYASEEGLRLLERIADELDDNRQLTRDRLENLLEQRKQP